MLTRFIQRLSHWIPVCLLVAATGIVVMAEAAGRTDEGKVEAIEIIYSAPDHKPVNPGTVIGGLAGGVIGHQIGSGRGKTAATVAGTIGGAVVGNEIDKKQEQEKSARYRITVRLDSGSTLIFEDTRDLNLRVGDRVRIEDGQLHRI
jgi:uncharacterized protein YcfJ